MKLKRPLLLVTALLGVPIATSLAGDSSGKSTAEKTTAKQSATAAKAKPEEVIPGADVQPAAHFYTGKPYDADLGGYVFNCRTYSPGTSRWLTPDPSGFPDGANNWLCSSNGITYRVDPDGCVYTAVYSANTKTVTVTLSILFFGPNATDAVSKAWIDNINATWSYTGTDAQNTNNPLTFKMNATYRVRADITFNNYEAANAVGLQNSICVAAPGSGLFSFSNEGGPNGMWNTDDLLQNGAAHEAGHLMGLADQYNVTNPNGIRVTTPKFRHENEIMADISKSPMKVEYNAILRGKVDQHRFE